MPVDRKSQHTVEPGDRLSRIAAMHGYASGDVVWNDPRNEELRQKRKNPETLIPGDVVHLPPKAPDTFDAPEKKQTTFRVQPIPSELVIKLGFTDKPLDGKVHVRIDSEPYSAEAPYEGDVTAAGGVVRFHVDPRVTQVDLSCEDPAFDVRFLVGHLQPIDDPRSAGVEQRLKNLGFHCQAHPGGREAKDGARDLRPSARRALSRFQAVSSPVEVDAADTADAPVSMGPQAAPNPGALRAPGDPPDEAVIAMLNDKSLARG